MKKRLKEMEEEAAALRDMQAKVEKEMSAAQGPDIRTFISQLDEVGTIMVCLIFR